MRIFCLCNNWLGWQVLRWLAGQNQGDEIVGLAVHPVARARYMREIQQEVESGNCRVLDGSMLKDGSILAQVRSLNADIGVSALFGYVLSGDFIRMFPRGCINLHPALLPHNRGAFPNVWSIVDKTPAGVTLHYIDEGVDTGDVIAQKEVEVKVTDTGESLYRKLEKEALELFRQRWPTIRAGKELLHPQRGDAGSYHRARDVEKIDEIELQKTYLAGDLIDVIRARTFPPHAGAYFVHEGKKVYLRLELEEESEKE